MNNDVLTKSEEVVENKSDVKTLAPVIEEPLYIEKAVREHAGIYNVVKRIIDVTLSLIGLVVLFPVFLLISLSIKIEDMTKPKNARGAIFFSHKRLGHKGKQITIYKFRSMVKNAEDMMEFFTPEQKEEFAKNFKLEDDPRITKTGNFLRKTSLDELPQIWNILKGDLSIVGPRPVVKDELEKYGAQKNKFLSAKPGLTGYWQVNGRNDITYEDRIERELYYIDNKSFLLDLKIFFMTFIVIFTKRGAK